MKAYKRILLKISGESLIGNKQFGLDNKTIKQIASEIKNVFNSKIELCIVVGGGNIFRGIPAASEGIDRSTADYMGMLATLINALSLQNALEKNNNATIKGIPTGKSVIFAIINKFDGTTRTYYTFRICKAESQTRFYSFS